MNRTSKQSLESHPDHFLKSRERACLAEIQWCDNRSAEWKQELANVKAEMKRRKGRG